MTKKLTGVAQESHPGNGRDHVDHALGKDEGQTEQRRHPSEELEQHGREPLAPMRDGEHDRPHREGDAEDDLPAQPAAPEVLAGVERMQGIAEVGEADASATTIIGPIA